MSLPHAIDTLLGWLAAASWQLTLFIGAVAVAASLVRKASPRLRYGLWALVLVKALLPTTFGGTLVNAPWSAGRWAVTPVEQQLPVSARRLIQSGDGLAPQPGPRDAAAADAPTATPTPTPTHGAIPADPIRLGLVGAWALGCLGLGAAVIAGYTRLRSEVAQLTPVEEGPIRVALESAAMAVGLPDADRIDLRLANRPTGTFLMGVRRPVIVLAREAAEQLGPDELVGVLAHELIHWRRRDTWVGWAQALVTSLFWFHPLVWWATAQLRHERERCCDDAVLRLPGSDPESYGEAIVRSLTIGRGRPIGLSTPGPLAAAGLVGVFERGATLQQRLEDVMNFRPARGRFGWRSAATLGLFAVVFLPLASADDSEASAQEEEIAKLSLDSTADAGLLVESDTETKFEGVASTRITTKWPTTVCLAEVESPAVEGAQLIYSARVKADVEKTASLEMWAHLDGGVFFSRNPNAATYGKSDWKRLEIPFFFKAGQRPDKVTLNLIVGSPGTVWVDDIRLLKRPLPPGFGAQATQAQPVTKTTAAKPATPPSPFPRLAKTVPEIGATEVDPSLDEIRVTFDRDMQTGGMSWTGGGDEFPPIDKSRQAKWLDARTCVLPVSLKKGAFYRVGVNSKSYQNFKSSTGDPAEHRVLSFSTKGAKRSVMRKAHVPEIVEMSPALGATEVDPATKRISVTFDTRMGGGMSWVTLDRNAWPGSDERARWSQDGRTCTLPVELAPGRTYRVGLNGSHYVNFQSRFGVPIRATEWTFTTGED